MAMGKHGNPTRMFQDKSRVFSRGQGCWNCIHSNSGNDFWTEKRQKDLELALKTSLISPMGEEDPKVVNIRTMVDKVDHGVASGALLRCTKGRTADGKDVGDFVVHNYLCDRWSGKQGASLAREGGKADILPEELADKIDGKPTSLADLLAKVPANKKVD